MGRRATRKPSAADYLASPLPTASPNQSMSQSPSKKVDFNLDRFADATSSLKKGNTKRSTAAAYASVPMQPTVSPSPLKNISSISDLKDLASSRLDSMKRHVDRSHSEILKDVEGCHSRLHKRLKIQTQASQQVTDEAEKEYKKMTDRITESQEAMKASYLEFIAEAQASASRVYQTSIPGLAQSLEKSIESLRSRYGCAST